MPPSRWVVGVDIGGTNLEVGLVPVRGDGLVGRRSRRTRPEEGADAVVDRVVEMVREALEELYEVEEGEAEVEGVGIGCPGPLDRAAGVVVTTPNLGWRNYPVRDRIAEALNLPAALDNDANCAALGEWWQGAGQGSRVLVALTLGTGIGGGIVVDGRVFHGVADVAGEIGHTTVNLAGRRCKCGNYGCLEAYASGPNIAQRAVEGLESGEESVLPELVGGELSRISAATISEAALQDDRYAVHVLTETAEILGTGIANVMNLLNPDVVVIAGGVTRAGELLFAPLRSEVRRRAFSRAVESCRIVPAGLPDSAGIVGAAAVFQQQNAGGL